MDHPLTAPSWYSLLLPHLRAHKSIALGLGLALLGILVLLAQSLLSLHDDILGNNLRLALIGSSLSFATTALGALPILLIRHLSQRFEDSLLGMAAGMMLAASAFSLLMPGLEAGTALFGHKGWGAALVILGMLLGVLLMLGLDSITPHEHAETGACGPGYQNINRVWLFVFAIALHNLPEGMAIGVGFSQGDLTVGIPLTTAIAIQNIPEGLAVALALRSAGTSSGFAILIAALSGLMEPIGAILGVGLASGLPSAYPIGLGLAAGAMIFIVSHEVIPQTHRNGHQTAATLGLMFGFALMMVLDTTLG